MKLFDWFKSRFTSQPAELYLKIDEKGVTSEGPDRVCRTILWHQLHKITVMTTFAKPFANDVWFVLYGSISRCFILKRDPRVAELVERFQKYPSFDHEAVLKAQNRPNRQFVCWKRGGWPAGRCESWRRHYELSRHFHGSLSTTLSCREVAELFYHYGWLGGQTDQPFYDLFNFPAEYKICTGLADLLLAGKDPMWLCGPISSVEEVVPMIDAVLSSAGIEYQFESSQVQDDLVKEIQRKDIVYIKRLLAEDADPNRRSGFYSSAIAYAAAHDETGEIIRLLVEAGANVNLQDAFGRTPLHTAAMIAIEFAERDVGNEDDARFDEFDWKMVGMLLDFGADPTIRDAKGQTVYDVAQAYGDYPRMAFEEFLRARDTDGHRTSNVDRQ